MALENDSESPIVKIGGLGVAIYSSHSCCASNCNFCTNYSAASSPREITSGREKSGPKLLTILYAKMQGICSWNAVVGDSTPIQTPCVTSTLPSVIRLQYVLKIRVCHKWRLQLFLDVGKTIYWVFSQQCAANISLEEYARKHFLEQ